MHIAEFLSFVIYLAALQDEYKSYLADELDYQPTPSTDYSVTPHEFDCFDLDRLLRDVPANNTASGEDNVDCDDGVRGGVVKSIQLAVNATTSVPLSSESSAGVEALFAF